MTAALYDYVVNATVHEPDAVRRLRECTETMPESEMLIPPEQGKFLHLLVHLIQAQKTLEIGVFTGYSALWTALAFRNGGRLVGCDINETWPAVGQPYWKEAGVADRIEVRIGPASESLSAMLADSQAETFDFVFIDADKVSYADYYEKALALVRPGGLIALDNCLRSGEVADMSATEAGTMAIKKLNTLIAADDRVDASLLPIADGLMLAVRRR